MQDDCCKPPEIASTVCHEECCVGPTEKPQDSDNVSCGRGDITVVDECCTPKSNDRRCKKSCCAEPNPPQVEDPNNPSCCKGKASPCCDVSCLDRLALRECENRNEAAQPDHAFKSRLKRSVQRRYLLLTSPIHSSHSTSCKLLQPRT
jgi:Cu2+-exporting ATPase